MAIISISWIRHGDARPQILSCLATFQPLFAERGKNLNCSNFVDGWNRTWGVRAASEMLFTTPVPHSLAFSSFWRGTKIRQINQAHQAHGSVPSIRCWAATRKHSSEVAPQPAQVGGRLQRVGGDDAFHVPELDEGDQPGRVGQRKQSLVVWIEPSRGGMRKRSWKKLKRKTLNPDFLFSSNFKTCVKSS